MCPGGVKAREDASVSSFHLGLQTFRAATKMNLCPALM